MSDKKCYPKIDRILGAKISLAIQTDESKVIVKDINLEQMGNSQINGIRYNLDKVLKDESFISNVSFSSGDCLVKLKGKINDGELHECRQRETYKCMKLTKENKDEFLKIFEPNLFLNENINIINENDKYIAIEHPFFKYHYKFGNWYVMDGTLYYGAERYTEEEFCKEFELV